MKKVRLVGTFVVTSEPKGERGPQERCRQWAPGMEWTAGGDGEKYGDLCYEPGHDIPYECVVSHTSVADEPPSVLAVHSDPAKRYWRAGEKRYMLATDISLSRLILASEIDVQNLKAVKLETISDEATIRISDGIMEVFGSQNKLSPNIRFGVNEDGFAVLQYFDNSGNFLYDLGPKGISNIDVREESWLTYHKKYLGAEEDTAISGQEYIGVMYSDGTDVYKYVCQKVAGVKQDPDNDGKFFTSKTKSTTDLVNGWYCKTAPLGATKESYEELMLEDTPGVGFVPEDISIYNPGYKTGYGYAVFIKQLELYENGVLVRTQNVYWSVPVVTNM